MKTNEKENKVIRGGDLVESSFGIAEEDQHHILSILRDKLYSDKILAVIREYSTNAVDAHVEVGKDDVPIKVTLPTRLDPNMRIRDFGPGLDEDDVRNVYAMYGRSTKRQTNKAVGQLGLGCKSGFAYGDQFMITSWVGGKKTVYTAYLDETNVGSIAKLSEEESTEEDGIEIQIAVAAEDVPRFHRKAAYLFSFFDVTPNVERLNTETAQIQEFEYWLEGELDNGVKWGLQDQNSEPVAVMGGIPYAIEQDQFDFGDRGQYVLAHGIHIWFRIGDLQMAANREALEYNEKTKKHIKLVIKDVINRVADMATKKLAEAKTLKEANITFNRLTKESVFKHFTANTEGEWKDQAIDGRMLVIPDRPDRSKMPRWQRKQHKPEADPENEPFRVQEAYLNKKWSRDAKVWTLNLVEADFVKATERTVLIEMDTSTKWRMKTEYYLAQQATLKDPDPYNQDNGTKGKETYIISFKDEKERKKAFKDWKLDEWEILKISEMDDPPSDFKPEDAPTMSRKEKKKHTKKLFRIKGNYETHPNRKSDNWEIVDIDLDDDTEVRYFVEIDSFFPTLWGVRKSYSDLRFLLGQVPKFGIKVDQLYGLKPPMVKKVADKDHWKRLDDVGLEEALKWKPRLLSLIARDASLHAAPHSLKPYSEHRDKFPKGCAMRELLEFYIDLRNRSRQDVVDDEVVRFLGMAGHNLKREAAEELDRLLDAVRDRYPLLSHFRIFPDGFHHGLGTKQVDAVVQYVSIIEREHAMEADEDDF